MLRLSRKRVIGGVRLSKVYNPESAGKDRTRLSKSIVIALRELMRQPEPNAQTRDLTAFIVLALEEINENIDTSVEAWEKRGYWVKADKFRLDWEWSGKYSKNLRSALLKEDWGNVALSAVQIGQKLKKLTIAEHHRLGTPWVGAFNILEKKRTAS
jgi:hypothetical protein